MRIFKISLGEDKEKKKRRRKIGIAMLVTWFLSIGLLYFDDYTTKKVMASSGEFPVVKIVKIEKEIKIVEKEEIIEKTIRYSNWQEYLDLFYEEEKTKDWVEQIVHCESKGNARAVNSQEVFVKGKSYGHATGLGQYLPDTWARNCTGDIFNEFDQVDCMIQMYQNGQAREWTCNNFNK